MAIRIVSPGLLTSIQDIGRFGFQKDGVIVSGAMDTVALRIGNLLVGNEENGAAIEATLTGPEVYFEDHHIIAITGANLSPQINGKAIELWRPIFVKKGSTLTFGCPRSGCRTYLAIAGGFDIPKVMNSTSTYLRAAIGGWKGRPLQAGDQISCKGYQKNNSLLQWISDITSADEPFRQARWSLSPFLYPQYKESPLIRAVTGPEFDWFSTEIQEAFWKEEFLLTPQSDRMGLRLKGPSLILQKKEELLSGAVTFGTVQIPSEGNPIVLMADHPTTGGYPRIAQVITADLPKLAQLTPGKKIKFQKVSLQEAQQLLFQQEQNMDTIKKALNIKMTAGENEQLFG